MTGSDFSIMMPNVNTDCFNIYLAELSKSYKGKKINLVMDQAGWHKSKTLKVPKNITIIYLPPYSLDLFLTFTHKFEEKI